MSKKFDKTAVPQEAFAEWEACDERPLSEHFLKGWLIATEAVIKAAGISLEQLTSRDDQKSVFGIIKSAAKQKIVDLGKMSVNTFERYCKIARYCIIFGCPWEVAENATRNQLRECKQRIKDFKVGTTEEKWLRAWKEESDYQKEKKEREKAERAKYNTADEDQVAGQELVRIPLPKDGQTEDAYWLEYLTAQVAHITKHMDKLDGDSNIKKVVTNFYASALPVVKASKAKTKATTDVKEAA